MRRGLWFLAGASVGVYAMVRGRRAAEALTVEGLHDRWQALEVGARLFREEVAAGRAEAEEQLRERFGPPAVGGPGTPALPAGDAAQRPAQRSTQRSAQRSADELPTHELEPLPASGSTNEASEGPQ